MKINRKQLLNNLQDFASRGNGVIIGSPGVGKTYLLKELSQSLKSVGTPHLLLPIDQLGNGMPKTLRQELSYEGDLIKKLKSVPVSDKKAILLFDAFDAARNEKTRKRFLNLIRRAIQELGKWNVIVTVRTYDAEKSQELLDLFGAPDDTDLTLYHTKGILCRHFTIPPLNEDELQQAFDQIPYLKSIYKSGSQDFKRLLANPFNLWLLEKILRISQDVPDFSQIRSEVQLLGLFWQRRIEVADNEDHRLFVLTQVARQMVKKRSLTVRLDNIYDNLDLDKPGMKMAWDSLLSDEILAKVSSTGQRIAFSHNILFDYAVSILLIEDTPEQLEAFIRKDPSRPLFLRPSLTYFFTRLWYDTLPRFWSENDRENFWNAFWHILPSNQSVHLRLFAHLIPTSVIANEVCEIDQLRPLLEKLQNGEAIANEAVMRLLQSLRSLQIKRDALWSKFFDQVSAHLHTDFAWDLTTLTSEILERATETENTTVIETCGRVGRQLLEWVWQEKENDWYNQFGSYSAIPLVAKTYGTNVEKSRELLKKTLELTREHNRPISFMTCLTKHVDQIWGDDPEFVTLIYRAVFTHDEASDKQTNQKSPVHTLITTRRQDYKMCRYWLVKHSSNFLRATPLVATRTIIQSLNFLIVRRHITDYRQEGVVPDDLTETFKFRGKPVYFVQDQSYLWDVQGIRDESIKMADALFEFIAGLARSEKSLPLLDSLLDVFRDNVWVAFLWKRLLKVAAQFPKVFAPRLFELCIATPIQTRNETLYELRFFLENATSEFTPEQRLQIEKTKEIERENSVPKNRPRVNSRYSETYSEEQWLQEQGVDTTKPENQKIQRFFDPLDKFRSNWRNGEPTERATESILPPLKAAYKTIKSTMEADREVIDSLWYKLTSCAAILGQVADNPESHLFNFCREVLLDGATHELPKPEPQRDAQFNDPAYSPCPRHEAARGLLRLTARHPDPEILDAIELLANDRVPSVRMVTAMELSAVYVKTPERFWNIVDKRAECETSHVVQKYFYHTLTRVVVAEKENEAKTTRVMDKLLKCLLTTTDKLEPEDPFIPLLMWLAINRENPWALETIEDTFFKDPTRFATSLTRAVSQVMRNVVPKNLETDEGRETTKRAIAWLGQVITVASEGIKVQRTTLQEHRTEESEKKLYDIYRVIDEVITQLYFAVAYERDLSDKPVEAIPHKLRCRFYNEVKPLLQQVIDFALDRENGLMFAGTAHYFMRLLTSFLSCNPKEVLHLAEGVARSSEPAGYTLDSLAVRDVVEFVEIVLADHRHEVRDGESLEDLLNLLDIFAKTGWSDALRLVWRLDEVFR